MNQTVVPTEAPVIRLGAAGIKCKVPWSTQPPAPSPSRQEQLLEESPVLSEAPNSCHGALATVGSEVWDKVSSWVIFSRQFLSLEISFPLERT